VRDVSYDEDRCQIRTGSGPHVMAALRDAAIGALRLAGVTNIAAATRHYARDSTRPLALFGLTCRLCRGPGRDAMLYTTTAAPSHAPWCSPRPASTAAAL
jgi:hypothetical protein